MDDAKIEDFYLIDLKEKLFELRLERRGLVSKIDTTDTEIGYLKLLLEQHNEKIKLQDDNYIDISNFDDD